MFGQHGRRAPTHGAGRGTLQSILARAARKTATRAAHYVGFVRDGNVMLAAALVALAAALVGIPDAAAQVGNSEVFDKLVEVGEDTHAGLILITRVLGVVAFVAFGAIMMVSRFQPRLLVGGVVGLLIAGFADPIVNFLFRA